MKRSKKIMVVASCILNANAKITPLAGYGGANMEFLLPLLNKGTGIVQLPCPETSFLGMRRWGMTKEQYDVPAYREHCRAGLRPVLLELQAFAAAGYEISGVAGVKGSPSCGVHTTCSGFTGGEIGCGHGLQEQLDRVEMMGGRGVFMDVLQEELESLGLTLDLFDVADPGNISKNV